MTNHGGPICKHKTRTYLCSECGGRGICKHNRQKQHCRDCGTTFHCLHGKTRYSCRTCAPLAWAKGVLRSMRKTAKERKHESPKITPEALVKLVKTSKRCFACDSALNWRAKIGPHLHHCHVTGEVSGFCHQLCNQAEGMLSKMSEQERYNFISMFFSELFN